MLIEIPIISNELLGVVVSQLFSTLSQSIIMF